MQLTTINILKVLPFEEEFKSMLVEEYALLPEDQQNAIARVAWDTYHALYQLKLEEKLQLAFAKAEKGEGSLDKEFYARVRKETEKELEDSFMEETKEVDLTEARKALELIMKEIRASKKKPRH